MLHDEKKETHERPLRTKRTQSHFRTLRTEKEASPTRAIASTYGGAILNPHQSLDLTLAPEWLREEGS
jgi:hypothetical protein